MSTSRIILIGFSGTGKTQVGRRVAQILGWRLVDTDEELAARSGKSIADIFAQDGETRFRELERQVVRRACRARKAVVSTGGGAIMDPGLRSLMLSSGLVVCLEATPETIYRRLRLGHGNGAQQEVRPLLAGKDPMERIHSLKQERQWAYALAHWTVHTDALSPEQVAQEVVHAWDLVGPPLQVGGGRGGVRKDAPDPDVAAVVETSSDSYAVYVGWDVLEAQLGTRIQEMGLGASAYLISDQTVFPHHGRVAQRSLEAAGVPCHVFVVPAGEQSKSLGTAQDIYRWLAEGRAERGHVIVAVGGGVVGDLAGFVAATYLRGMPVVQVPTSLAAMVDASIGGKVAVNLEHGKNLVGAFHQPRLVLSDVKALTTMPARELREGWAEAIKHGLIMDRTLFELFERRAEGLLALERSVTTEVIRRNVAIKAQVVSEDERETTGARTLLNYGHSIGHGLEAASGYSGYLHGEAVAIGMMGAARLGHRLGVTPQRVIERQQRMLEAFGLPTRFQGVEVEGVLEAMTRDKKISGGAVRWVLLQEVGRATIRADVPEELVRQVVESLVVS